MRYVWRGRLRRQIERVFVAYPGELLPTGLFHGLGLAGAGLRVPARAE
jgi:hypothetical protein